MDIGKLKFGSFRLSTLLNECYKAPNQLRKNVIYNVVNYISLKILRGLTRFCALFRYKIVRSSDHDLSKSKLNFLTQKNVDLTRELEEVKSRKAGFVSDLKSKFDLVVKEKLDLARGMKESRNREISFRDEFTNLGNLFKAIQLKVNHLESENNQYKIYFQNKLREDCLTQKLIEQLKRRLGFVKESRRSKIISSIRGCGSIPLKDIPEEMADEEANANPEE